MTEKTRLDAALVERGLCTGRDRAKGVIMAGQVYVNRQKADKPGMTVSPQDEIELRGDQLAYVSRGGLKLEKAIKEFDLRLQDLICADIGASTGGFTDCMLQNGAARVYAIDVGYGQLAWKLRCDERVVNLERTNIRHVTSEQVPEPLDFASVDVSFISLKLVLPVLKELLKAGGEAVCLIKPQFEAGRELVGKKGVVREESTHIMVVENALSHAKENDFTPMHLTFSPVKGPEGNIEYLMHLKKGQYTAELPDPVQIVRLSHQTLAGE
ncbi:MAG: TlyA family RNA methyltransferase [Angelakisella sp.]